jgi:SOS response regulatory protein OraA/RecX
MEYTQERLFSYALWYTGKYPVSTKRLREKLHEKCSNASIVEAVIVSMEPYHSDATEIRSCIETLVHLRKPKTVIRQKLRIKGFIPDEFEAILGEF